MTCCTSCGADWDAGAFGPDCPQCGGGALERACPMCGGRCGARWRRAILDSWDANEAHWLGRCRLATAAGSGAEPSAWLALRSLLWTILLPGVVAGYVPWRFFGLGRAPLDELSAAGLLGLLAIGVGAVLLAACIVEFARSGRGTLSPVDPPRRLVVRGLYRYVRNPMYLSVTLILLGEILITGSTALAWYGAAWLLVVNLFVISYEEPTLRRQFGASYDDYTGRVGRWIPTFGSRSSSR